MDAVLLQTAELVILLCQKVQFQHLKERVSVLRSELDGELEMVLCIFITQVLVSGYVGHSQSSTFTPDLS